MPTFPELSKSSQILHGLKGGISVILTGGTAQSESQCLLSLVTSRNAVAATLRFVISTQAVPAGQTTYSHLELQRKQTPE